MHWLTALSGSSEFKSTLLKEDYKPTRDLFCMQVIRYITAECLPFRENPFCMLLTLKKVNNKDIFYSQCLRLGRFIDLVIPEMSESISKPMQLPPFSMNHTNLIMVRLFIFITSCSESGV